MVFPEPDSFDVTACLAGAAVPSAPPKKSRVRRPIDAHDELMKLHNLGVTFFESGCLVRQRKVDQVVVRMPGLRDGVPISSRLLEEAAEVASDLTYALAEATGVKAAGDAADEELFVRVRVVIGVRDELPILQGEVLALAGSEGADAARQFGMS